MFRKITRQYSQKSNILVVGGGQIGKSVALGLNRNGYENITVADPSNINQAELEAKGIKFASTAEGLAKSAEIVFTALPKPEHVRFVMEDNNLLGEMEKGTIWIDHTSTDPDEAVRIVSRTPHRTCYTV